MADEEGGDVEATEPVEDVEAPAEEVKKEEEPKEEPCEDDGEPEELFLLEFVLDRVSLGYHTKQDLKCMAEGQTCVCFTFLENGPYTVCEDDFEPKERNYIDGCTGSGHIKNGRSIMFSLTKKEQEAAANRFFLRVDTYRRLDPPALPPKIQIGRSLIRGVKLFQELLKDVEKGYLMDIPPRPMYTKSFKDCFKIYAVSTNEVVGHMFVYLRLSYFGKMIVNQFCMSDIDRSISYKSNEGHYQFKYGRKPKDKFCPSPFCPKPFCPKANRTICPPPCSAPMPGPCKFPT